MLEIVTLELVLPPALGDADQLHQDIRERVAAVEVEVETRQRHQRLSSRVTHLVCL